MFKDVLADSAVRILSESGFRVVDCRGSRSSFDILARRGERLLLVKTLANVEGLSREGVMQLKSVSGLLGGIPMIVSKRMKSSELADDVVYDRYGVCVSNLRTLDRMINDIPPTVHSKRGAYCVKVNSDRLSLERRKMGLTQESLAKRLGVSKQSVYRYESSGSVSLEVFSRLRNLFGDGLAEHESSLEIPSPDSSSAADMRGSNLKMMVRQEFETIGFDTSLTNAPFDILAAHDKRVLSVVSNDWRRLNDKLHILEEVSELVEGYSVCISERKVKSDVSVLNPGQLAKIKSAGELFKLLTDK